MRHQRRFGKFPADPDDARMSELDVGITVPAPQGHCLRLFDDPSTQVFIRHEEQVAIFRRGVDDFDGNCRWCKSRH